MSSPDTSSRLPASAIGAAVLIAAVWGFNFVVIKVGVAGFPPLMLAAMRFFFSALPAVFFVPRPKAPMKTVAAYGLLLGVGEFGFLFTAVKLGAPAGVSSILLQAQAFFTAVLAALILKEKFKSHNVAGMAVAACGLGAFGASAFSASTIGAGGAGAPGLSPLLLGMLMLAALGWAGANIAAKKAQGSGALSLMAWSSLFSPLPLAALSLAFEGPAAIASSFSSVSALTIGALAYLVILSTLLGYGLWNRLIMRYGAARIAPFSMMVPIFGVLSAYLALGEVFSTLDAVGAFLILAGLLVHAFGGRKVKAR
jgi:O-acetylserine/cysteine efflux transporter